MKKRVAIRGPKANIRQIPAAWSVCRRKLLMLRDRLVQDSGILTMDAKVAANGERADMLDSALDESEKDLTVTFLSRNADALYEIEEALRRIDDGSYGKCESTGKPIPQARLRAIPWTRYTADAERRLEMSVAKVHASPEEKLRAHPRRLPDVSGFIGKPKP